jgi:hypothetical protein
MTRARVPCRLTYRYTCEACTAEAEVDLRLEVGDPLLPPQHYLPLGWHVFDAHTVCPQHTLAVEDVP